MISLVLSFFEQSPLLLIIIIEPSTALPNKPPFNHLLPHAARGSRAICFLHSLQSRPWPPHGDYLLRDHTIHLLLVELTLLPLHQSYLLTVHAINLMLVEFFLSKPWVTYSLWYTSPAYLTTWSLLTYSLNHTSPVCRVYPTLLHED